MARKVNSADATWLDILLTNANTVYVVLYVICLNIFGIHIEIHIK